MDAFCLRSFAPAGQHSSSASIPGQPDEFVLHINRAYEQGQQQLTDGYAPFCKHLFIHSHLDVQAAYTAITQRNRHLLQSADHTTARHTRAWGEPTPSVDWLSPVSSVWLCVQD